MSIPAFMTNAMTSDFLSSISPGWVVMFIDSRSMVFTFLSWLDLLGVALAFQISISQNLQITSKLLTQGYRYHKLRKTFGKFFRSYSDLLSKFGDISFQENVSEGIFHPVFYGHLVYKLRRVKCEANFVSSGSKIVKLLRCRKYDPVIIERTIGLVLGPSTAMYRSPLKHCSDEQGDGDYMMGLVQTSSEETRPRSSSPLIVSWDSFSPWTWARFQTGGA